MYGGLKKSASRLALVAAAGVLSTNAYAADLGGDCCADLEERVAELEATTARKGTRKTSLEIWGQVNMAVTGFSDGNRTNAELFGSNTNGSTRFGFRGNAKISPAASAGYSIVLDVGDHHRTNGYGQTQDGGSSRFAGGGTSRADDYAVRLRDANFWIESASLGRLTMGRITSEVAVGTPDIGGVMHAIGTDPGCNGGGIAFRTQAAGNALTGNSISSLSSGCGGPWGNRANGLKYQTPTLAGFQVVATYAGNLKTETNHIDSTAANAANFGVEYGIGARYAGEFSGIRIAANGGVQWDRFDRDLANVYANKDAVATTSLTNSSLDYSSADTRLVDFGLGLMHVATGIFANGNWARVSINAQLPGTSGATSLGSRDASRWHVLAGIGQNWFGMGKTSFYGEYARFENFKNAYNQYTAVGTAFSAVTGTVTSTGFAATPNTPGDSLRYWGVGINQAIDAAALDLYLNYRNFTATDPGTVAGLKPVSIVTTGGRIRF